MAPRRAGGAVRAGDVWCCTRRRHASTDDFNTAWDLVPAGLTHIADGGTPYLRHMGMASKERLERDIRALILANALRADSHDRRVTAGPVTRKL